VAFESTKGSYSENIVTSCRDAVPILVEDPPGVSARYTMYDTTSGSGFCVQVRSTSPLPPPVWAVSPTTCRGAGFGADVGVLVGAGDTEDGDGGCVEWVGAGVVAGLELE
jgi:hypothetical protein